MFLLYFNAPGSIPAAVALLATLLFWLLYDLTPEMETSDEKKMEEMGLKLNKIRVLNPEIAGEGKCSQLRTAPGGLPQAAATVATDHKDAYHRPTNSGL